MYTLELGNLPPTVVVLAGGWESNTAFAPPMSIETRMRVGALAVLARHSQEPVHAIFSGGVTNRAGDVEATEMAAYWEHKIAPQAACDVRHVEVSLEPAARNTSTSAKNIRRLLPPDSDCTLLTSETHLKRAAQTFERNGFAGHVFPISAETLLWAGTAQESALARGYVQSNRYRVRRAAEFALGAAHAMDPGDLIIDTLTRFGRRVNRGLK